jgi:PAS domain S-box-containing protein
VSKLKAENEELRIRLEEAEETIRAIRSGAVDALVVEESGGNKVYTLEGADRPYRLLVEQMLQGAAMLQNGVIIYCNVRLAEYLQVPHQRLIGARLHEFILSEDRATFEQLLQHGKTGSGQGEIRLDRQDGEAIPVLLTCSSLPKECGIEIAVLMTDLSAQKHQSRIAAEQTSKMVQSEETLRALASQLGTIEQQERQRLATELHDHLAQLLAVGSIKASSARQKIRRGEAVDGLLWDEIIDVFTQANSYTRTLMAELNPSVLHELGLPLALRWLGGNMLRYGLTVEVFVDQEKLDIPEHQAVFLFHSARELLWNILKHAQTDRAVLSLDTSSTQCVRLSIQDQGKGFDYKTIEQGIGTAGRHFGLFSIRERIKAVGGKMTIDTAIGKGTSITLETTNFTAGTLKPITTASAHSIPSFEQSRRRDSLRILLVDDHAMVRQGLRGILTSYPGLEVIAEARNGEEALTLAIDLYPDIVLMDINMPTLDGITATKRMKEVLPGTIVIGLSVNRSASIIDAMTAAGASAFVSKEMAGDDLYATIMSAALPA